MIIEGGDMFHRGWLAYLFGEPPTPPVDGYPGETWCIGYETAHETPSCQLIATVILQMRQRGQIVIRP